ncbi:helix-turn-helix domain-containing protein [Streptomyces sp. NPDC051840]|uniref:helix-turn-helix domain-containing protein n=1 Tax=unclassified Streptomyces TaxID=2593676 RepID=UPI00343A43BA
MSTPGFHNPEIFEVLPNARLSRTARDVLDILTARQEPGGTVHIRQKEIASRLGITQAAVSRAMGQLKDRGLIEGRQRQGTVLIHPLLAAYESAAHMVNHLRNPATFVWPLNFASDRVRPPRHSDPRSDTDFDPDPDGGERTIAPSARPPLHLVG